MDEKRQNFVNMSRITNLIHVKWSEVTSNYFFMYSEGKLIYAYPAILGLGVWLTRSSWARH